MKEERSLSWFSAELNDDFFVCDPSFVYLIKRTATRLELGYRSKVVCTFDSFFKLALNIAIYLHLYHKYRGSLKLTIDLGLKDFLLNNFM